MSRSAFFLKATFNLCLCGDESLHCQLHLFVGVIEVVNADTFAFELKCKSVLTTELIAGDA